jgi:hypothetical protein
MVANTTALSMPDTRTATIVNDIMMERMWKL